MIFFHIYSTPISFTQHFLLKSTFLNNLSLFLFA
nr:MAG TPA: hypothetical protein [Caudoviricetes sp.]